MHRINHPQQDGLRGLGTSTYASLAVEQLTVDRHSRGASGGRKSRKQRCACRQVERL